MTDKKKLGEEGAVADVAAKLTEAQRRAVMSCGSNWRRLYGPGTGAYKGASVREIFDYSGWPTGTGWKHSARLTPLGLAVRQHLEQGATAGVKAPS